MGELRLPSICFTRHKTGKNKNVTGVDAKTVINKTILESFDLLIRQSSKAISIRTGCASYMRTSLVAPNDP